MNDIKGWDWAIEATENGYCFFEMKCHPAFGSGRYTKQEVDLASKEFNKVDNPNIPRSREEGIDLINKIKSAISSTNKQ